MIRCAHCKKLRKDLMVQSRNTKKGKTYTSYVCRPCCTARLKKYRKEHPDKIKAIVQKYDAKNPEKRKAWNKVYTLNLRYKPCQWRGCKRSDTVAHHPDYSKPEKVRFLCRPHHKRVHRKDTP